jgi:exopolysaccharide biosynthesis protein
VLLIDEDGNFHPVHLPKKGEITDRVDGKKVLNAICFDPVLVENGEVRTDWKDFGYLKPNELYARLALCQVGPLHYKVILTTHLQSYTTGIHLKDFAQLCKDEGAIVAYNLDGGESTTLFFHGERQNSQYKVVHRPVPDIFYFASSWNGGSAE